MVQLLTLSMAAIFFMKKNGYREPLYFFSSSKLETLIKQSLSRPITLPPPKIEEGDYHFTGSTFVASMPEENFKKSANALPAVEQETKENFSMIYVDQLLDKINATGLNSLTEQEKEKLEAARMALLERDRKD